MVCCLSPYLQWQIHFLVLVRELWPACQPSCEDWSTIPWVIDLTTVAKS